MLVCVFFLLYSGALNSEFGYSRLDLKVLCKGKAATWMLFPSPHCFPLVPYLLLLWILSQSFSGGCEPAEGGIRWGEKVLSKSERLRIPLFLSKLVLKETTKTLKSCWAQLEQNKECGENLIHTCF